MKNMLPRYSALFLLAAGFFFFFSGNTDYFLSFKK